MKKLYLLGCTLIAAIVSSAQTIPNGGMETWRSGTAGYPTFTLAVQAPVDWYGSDSLFIGIGGLYGGLLMIPDSLWNVQLFREDSIVHSGDHSAKLLTTYQDTILVAGSLSNGQANVGISLSPPGITGITFFGGLPVTVRPLTLSAWTRYYPGKDTLLHRFGGPDTAILSVTVVSAYGGTVGTGFALISPNSSWTQVTATINYTDTINTADTLRITFASSGGASQTLDSSILYVDDVTMTSEPEVSYVGVHTVTTNELVKIYPNPASDAIYCEGPLNAGLSCSLQSVSGQVVATKVLTGSDALDVSELPEGLYIYTITNQAGNTIQKGKITVTR